VIRVPLVRLARTPYTNGKRAQHPPSSPAQPPRQALRCLSNARHEEDYISESEDDEKDVLAMALGTTDTRRRGCQTTTEEEVDGISCTLPAATRTISVNRCVSCVVRSDSIRGVLRSPTAAIPFRAPVSFLCRVSFSSSLHSLPVHRLRPLYFCGATCYRHQKPFDTRRPRGVEEDSEGRAPPIPRDRY
jgi:hypothetical protein